MGKGLSKDEKAQKLALQHWLEAVSVSSQFTEQSVSFISIDVFNVIYRQIDPRHRYGHNLQFYYDCWLQRESMQPFFYWLVCRLHQGTWITSRASALIHHVVFIRLDVGEGKEVNLEEQCTRSTLQQQCIKYLGPVSTCLGNVVFLLCVSLHDRLVVHRGDLQKERDAYEVIIEDGRFMYRKNRQVIDSSEGPKDAKWIFVLSTLKKLYVAQVMILLELQIVVRCENCLG